MMGGGSIPTHFLPLFGGFQKGPFSSQIGLLGLTYLKLNFSTLKIIYFLLKRSVFGPSLGHVERKGIGSFFVCVVFISANVLSFALRFYRHLYVNNLHIIHCM